MNELNLSIYHDAGFSTQQMRSLHSFLESNPLHWIQVSPDGVFELVLDNQMMSDYRACPSYFIEAHILGIGSRGSNWYLEFGIWFHEMMKTYYTEFRETGFDMQNWAVNQGRMEWDKLNLDKHRDHKEYKSMGGFLGCMGLLVSYAMHFSAENERLRVIGTEIGFGHKKEVYLGSVTLFYDDYRPCTEIMKYLDCYLSGRIDLLVDTGDSICPLDHKTRGSFYPDPVLEYETDEGPTGYLYAVKQMTQAIIPQGMMNRNTNKIIMNFISKSIPSESKPRFKRSTVYKTDEQLESYRLRMLSTQESIFRDLVRFSSSLAVSRDTSKCQQWHRHECSFFAIHRQNSSANEELIRISNYDRREIWNTEEH